MPLAPSADRRARECCRVCPQRHRVRCLEKQWLSVVARCYLRLRFANSARFRTGATQALATALDSLRWGSGSLACCEVCGLCLQSVIRPAEFRSLLFGLWARPRGSFFAKGLQHESNTPIR
eukprot:2297517-Rhodomonas_salina.1